MSIIYFGFVPNKNHLALLEKTNYCKIHSIIKECCEMYPNCVSSLHNLIFVRYVLGLKLFYPTLHAQMEQLNFLLTRKYELVRILLSLLTHCRIPNNKFNGMQLLVDMLLEHHYNSSSFAKWAFGSSDTSVVAISGSIFTHVANVFFAQTEVIMNINGTESIFLSGRLIFCS